TAGKFQAGALGYGPATAVAPRPEDAQPLVFRRVGAVQLGRPEFAFADVRGQLQPFLTHDIVSRGRVTNIRGVNADGSRPAAAHVHRHPNAGLTIEVAAMKIA